MNFINKTFVITGASSGIGKALAIKLARSNANLVLAARNKDALAITADECLKNGGKAIVVPTDVTVLSECEILIKKAIEEYKAIDFLINNAGIGMYGKFEEIEDISIFEKVMQVNYLGAVYCTHYALPYLKESQGLLVAISSLTGKFGVPTRSGYAATKHAMEGFFDSLRVELRDTGVDVLIVCPGFVATDIRDRLLGKDGKIVAQENQPKNVMSTEVCVDLIIDAILKRKRELIMTFQGNLGVWLKLLLPNLVDWMAVRAISSNNK